MINPDVVFQSLTSVWLFVTPWTVAPLAALASTVSWSLLKFMSTELVMLSNHLILCRPLLLLSSVFHDIRVFSNESALLIRRPKYWSFSFSISPFSEYSGPISFRMDWFDILADQGTVKSLHQMYHSLIGYISNCYILLIVYLRNQCKHEFAVLLFAAASPELKTWEVLEEYLSSA